MLPLLIIGVVFGLVLMAWTTRLLSRRRSPGLRWQGIDWGRPPDQEAKRRDDPEA